VVGVVGKAASNVCVFCHLRKAHVLCKSYINDINFNLLKKKRKKKKWEFSGGNFPGGFPGDLTWDF
jgi:hypothetical protein